MNESKAFLIKYPTISCTSSPQIAIALDLQKAMLKADVSNCTKNYRSICASVGKVPAFEVNAFLSFSMHYTNALRPFLICRLVVHVPRVAHSAQSTRDLSLDKGPWQMKIQPQPPIIFLVVRKFRGNSKVWDPVLEKGKKKKKRSRRSRTWR